MIRIKRFISNNRKGNNAVSVECRHACREGDPDDWSSEVKRLLGEAEEMLWHLHIEISGWKNNLDSLIRKVDVGFSHILGLGKAFTG